MSVRRALRPLLLALAGLAGLAGLAALPGGALADTSTSSNWSGFAAHRAGVTFRGISASWIQPMAVCTGRQTYSSFWVGLGGFNRTARGLEQIGSELDCTAYGGERSSVWYELVPAPSRHIRMTVRPGDHLSASVTVTGHQVTFRLTDHTRGTSFFKQATTNSIDVTSADWIAEAPSSCEVGGSCRTLPLANFASARFSSASAQTVAGHQGPISDPAWNRTRLVLSQNSAFGSLTRTSTPSPLRSGGSAFFVRYGQTPGADSARASAAAVAGVLQPGGARR